MTILEKLEELREKHGRRFEFDIRIWDSVLPPQHWNFAVSARYKQLHPITGYIRQDERAKVEGDADSAIIKAFEELETKL